MPRFFFNLISPGVYNTDEIGSEFPNIEAAYLDAWQASIEIAFDALRDGLDPNAYQFEITDDHGRFLLELTFSEVMRPSARPANNPKIRGKLQQNIRRNRELQMQIRTECMESQRVLQHARNLLRKSRAVKLY